MVPDQVGIRRQLSPNDRGRRNTQDQPSRDLWAALIRCPIGG